jgi:hypothetical protein
MYFWENGDKVVKLSSLPNNEVLPHFENQPNKLAIMELNGKFD